MGIKIQVSGINQTKTMIKKLENKTDEETKKLVKETASKIQNEAMRTVPVDTGNLKRSIMLNISNDGQTATVTATADYSAYVEYGTRKMTARPFMRNSAEMVAQQLGIECEKVEKEITRGI